MNEVEFLTEADIPSAAKVIYDAFESKFQHVQISKLQGIGLLRATFKANINLLANRIGVIRVSVAGGEQALGSSDEEREAYKDMPGEEVVVGVCYMQYKGDDALTKSPTISQIREEIQISPCCDMIKLLHLSLLDSSSESSFNHNEGYLAEIAVDGSQRGNGLGSKLLVWAEQQVVERGLSAITLFVVVGNPAQRLYERYGYVVVHSRSYTGCMSRIYFRMLMGVPEGVHFMRKPIDHLQGNLRP